MFAGNCHHRLMLSFPLPSSTSRVCVCAVFVACHFGIKTTYCYIYHPKSVLFTHRRISSLFWYFLVWQTIHNRFPCQNPCHFPSLFLLSHTLLLSLSKNGASNFSQTLSIRKTSPHCFQSTRSILQIEANNESPVRRFDKWKRKYIYFSWLKINSCLLNIETLWIKEKNVPYRKLTSEKNVGWKKSYKHLKITAAKCHEVCSRSSIVKTGVRWQFDTNLAFNWKLNI